MDLHSEDAQISFDPMSPELQPAYQDHEEHQSSADEDDAGGVSIAQYPTATFYHGPLQNEDSEDTDMIDAEQTDQPTAPDISSTPQDEVPTETPVHILSNASPDGPTAMSVLSHQLEQIQEAQVFNDLNMGLYVGSVHFIANNNNSIPPTLLSSPLFQPSTDVEGANPSSDNGSVSIDAPTASIAISQSYPPSMAEMQNAAATDLTEILPHNSFSPDIDFGYGEVFMLSTADLDAYDEVDVNQNSYTLPLYDFLRNWRDDAQGRLSKKKKGKGPEPGSIERLRLDMPDKIHRYDLEGDNCDIQGIDWHDMGVTRQEARKVRKSNYKNYVSQKHYVEQSKSKSPAVLDHEDTSFLRFKRMDFQQKPYASHFQLRNLIACSSRSNVFYAGKNSKVYYSNPLTGGSSTVMDLSDPDISNIYSYHGVHISTLATKHNILLAGGFNGEYGMINLNSTMDSGHTQGVITEHPNSITNHISLSLSRSSGLPQAAFASNDNGIRVLDCTTNTFTSSHSYTFPVNCTAISPDSRLRVLVGDTTFVHIVNTDTGKTVQKLEGHSDFGFACAWADNGWHVATGNQDMTVKIWDARMWTDRYGTATPLRTIGSELAGVRSLQFSPLGSGKRILLACEASDFIDVIDAESYDSKQVLDFFGEIGGACFTPDGQDIFVANCDAGRGGIVEYERTGGGMRFGDSQKLKEDVAEINRDVARREVRAWLNDEEIDGRKFNTGVANNSRKFNRYPAGKYEDEPEDPPQPMMTDEIDWSGGSTAKTPSIPQASSPQREEESTSPEDDAQPEHQQWRRAWDAIVEEEEYLDDSMDDGYTSIEERMRRQTRGYDWRPTNESLIADSRCHGRTLTWYRWRHLFGSGNSEPLGEIDLGL